MNSDSSRISDIRLFNVNFDEVEVDFDTPEFLRNKQLFSEKLLTILDIEKQYNKNIKKYYKSIQYASLEDYIIIDAIKKFIASIESTEINEKSINKFIKIYISNNRDLIH
jgi:hypothetical protein